MLSIKGSIPEWMRMQAGIRMVRTYAGWIINA